MMIESNLRSAPATQRPLRIGDAAPKFQARTTLGEVLAGDDDHWFYQTRADSK